MKFIQTIPLVLLSILATANIFGQNESASNEFDVDFFQVALNDELTSSRDHSFDENLTLNEVIITSPKTNENQTVVLCDQPSSPYSIFDVQYSLNTSSEEHSTVPLIPVDLLPNPCKRNIYLITDSSVGEWQVWNSLGNILIQGNGKKVDASSLKEGIYFLKLADRVLPFIKENK